MGNELHRGLRKAVYRSHGQDLPQGLGSLLFLVLIPNPRTMFTALMWHWFFAPRGEFQLARTSVLSRGIAPKTPPAKGGGQSRGSTRCLRWNSCRHQRTCCFAAWCSKHHTAVPLLWCTAQLRKEPTPAQTFENDGPAPEKAPSRPFETSAIARLHSVGGGWPDKEFQIFQPDKSGLHPIRTS